MTGLFNIVWGGFLLALVIYWTDSEWWAAVILICAAVHLWLGILQGVRYELERDKGGAA